MGDGPDQLPLRRARVRQGRLAGPPRAGGRACASWPTRSTDVVVISHGWNNDMDEARAPLPGPVASLDAVRAGGPVDLGGRTHRRRRDLWPSKRFADAELIPGGAASAGAADPPLPADLRGSADAFDAP